MDGETRAAFDALRQYLDGRFGAIDHRFITIDGRFAQMDDRFETLDRKIDAQGVMLRTEILGVAQMVAANTESIALLRRDVNDLRTRR
jgi:hypothetical protein